MKITKLRVLGPTIVDFPIVGADPSGPYVLNNAVGMDPVPIVVRKDGTRVPQDRQIVMTVGLQPQFYLGQTAQNLREELYGLLTPRFGSMITLQLMDGDGVVAYAEGQITKMEATAFAKEPAVQITMDCLGATKSYFLRPNSVFVDPTLDVSDGTSTATLTNPGSAPSGFVMVIKLLEDVTEETHSETPSRPMPGYEESYGLRISIVGEDGQKISMLLEREFTTNDKIYIDTRFNQKEITLYTHGSGPIKSILGTLDPTADWLEFHSGENTLEFNAEVEWAIEDFFFAIEYVPAYWGI